MQFATTTEISRKGSKAFLGTGETIILNNNKMLGLYIPGDLGQAIIDSGVISQIKEELWEINDKETSDLIVGYKEGKILDSISLSDYKTKYGI